MSLEPLEILVQNLSKLPGVGRKTAQRLAYFILDMPKIEVEEMASALIQAKEKIRYCDICGHYSASSLCNICADDSRDASIICVVRDPRDVFALEATQEYRGKYHVLHGVLSPMDGIGPESIKISELLSRTQTGEIKEIIIATNSDVEGEATATYIAQLLKGLGVVTTRIAHGIPIGGNLEYVDELTLRRALSARREM